MNLKRILLIGNPIQDIEPLFDLLRRNPSIKIFLNDQYNVLQLPTTDPSQPTLSTTDLPQPTLSTTDPPQPPPLEPVYHEVIFSEFMFESDGGAGSLPQWIEVHNSGLSNVNLRGWKLSWKRLQPSLLEVTTTFKKDFIIPSQQSRLIVSTLGRHLGGGNFSDDFCLSAGPSSSCRGAWARRYSKSESSNYPWRFLSQTAKF